jgi:hypothetical protein
MGGTYTILSAATAEARRTKHAAGMKSATRHLRLSMLLAPVVVRVGKVAAGACDE